jgi:hypothetical protein
MYTDSMNLERLTQLQGEYEETVKSLRFPMTVEEHYQLKFRREAILGKARTLGDSLNLAGDQWFSRETK